MYQNPDGTYSFTYTPFDFYGFPPGTVVTEICAVFNNGTNWNQDGRDFHPLSGCMDFFIPLNYETGDPMIGFIVNMNKMIYDGLFDPDNDDVYVEIYDVGEYLLWDGDQDGIYSENVFDSIFIGNTYEFIFRINNNLYENSTRFVSPIYLYNYVNVWWNDEAANLSIFQIDMSHQVDLGNFDPQNDFVDIAGSMNNWQGSDSMTHMSNYIYKIIYSLDNDSIYEYKYRINGDWATSEFINGDPRYFLPPDTFHIVYKIYNDYKPNTFPATFLVHMGVQQDSSNFNPAIDYLDIAGFMNNWGAYDVLFDPDTDRIYQIRINIDETMLYQEFKFRINGDWSTSEFPGGGPNREWNVKDTAGNVQNIYECWYNDSYPLEKADATFNVNMNYQIDIGNFDPANDFVDVIGTMNNWTPANVLLDPDNDGIYSTTIGNLYINEPYQYKFRINASWSTAELQGLPNRKYTIQDTTGGFQNILTHWFNDEIGTITEEYSIPSSITIYPNPAHDLIFIRYKTPLSKITVFNITGNVVFDMNYIKSKKYSITIRDFANGIYIIKCIDHKGCVLTNKLIKK
jgi:hypothetical protein